VAAGEADELAQERHVAQPRNGKVVRVKHNPDAKRDRFEEDGEGVREDGADGLMASGCARRREELKD
jgi:hypothetical protein